MTELWNYLKPLPDKNAQLVTRVWQKWRFSAPQTHLWLIKVWFSALAFVVKIATFAKPETVISKPKRRQCNHKQTTKNWTLTQKQTISTSDQHTDHISNGQRVSRHSLPTLLYFLFSPPHIFFNSILASRTNGTFGFARHTSRPFAKPKEPFFAHALMTVFSNIKLTLQTNFKNRKWLKNN